MIGIVFPVDIMIVDLADFHIRINSDRLYTENFQRPVTGKPYVAKSGSDMDKDTQTANILFPNINLFS